MSDLKRDTLIWFHISRTASINLGQVYARNNQGDNEKALQLKEYPDSPSSIIEDIFEEYRAIHFPDQVSRLKAFYATDRLGIEKWAEPLGLIHNKIMNGATMVYTIEVHEKLPIYDARWLGYCRENNLPADKAKIEQMAHCYWCNKETEDPLYEFLCPFPVSIIKEEPFYIFQAETIRLVDEYRRTLNI